MSTFNLFPLSDDNISILKSINTELLVEQLEQQTKSARTEELFKKYYK